MYFPNLQFWRILFLEYVLIFKVADHSASRFALVIVYVIVMRQSHHYKYEVVSPVIQYFKMGHELDLVHFLRIREGWCCVQRIRQVLQAVYLGLFWLVIILIDIALSNNILIMQKVFFRIEFPQYFQTKLHRKLNISTNLNVLTLQKFDV